MNERRQMCGAGYEDIINSMSPFSEEIYQFFQAKTSQLHRDVFLNEITAQQNTPTQPDTPAHAPIKEPPAHPDNGEVPTEVPPPASPPEVPPTDPQKMPPPPASPVL
ncbi:MAG: hypothetical protein K0R08_1440 [Solimicrobium sp.]|jgi:hypothetical protein|nr:hypothetical protein [Solimicrobium sp.]